MNSLYVRDDLDELYDAMKYVANQISSYQYTGFLPQSFGQWI